MDVLGAAPKFYWTLNFSYLHCAASKIYQKIKIQKIGKIWESRGVSPFCIFCTKFATSRYAHIQTFLTTVFLLSSTNQYGHLYMQGTKEENKMNNTYPFPMNQIPGYNQLQQI